MKRDPLDVVGEYDARRHQHLGEVVRVDAVFVVPLEANAALLQHVDGVLRVHVVAARRRDNGINLGGGGGDETKKGIRKLLRRTKRNETETLSRATYCKSNLKLNCHVDTGLARFPCSSENVKPICII